MKNKEMSANIFGKTKIFQSLIIVFALLVQATHSQTTYVFGLNQQTRNFYNTEDASTLLNPLTKRLNYTDTTYNNQDELDKALEEQRNNSAIIIVKNIRDNPAELSQTAMDVITIVWYVATFLALAAFFLLMACSDRRCADTQRNNNTRNANENPIPPPTPSPSYSEFAPPSYESVIKKQHSPHTSIFVIPFTLEGSMKDANDQNINNNNNNMNNNNNNNNNNITNSGSQPNTPNTPVGGVTFYTINELQKLGN